MVQSALARLFISPPLFLNGFSAEKQAREEGIVSLLYGEGCVVWLVVNRLGASVVNCASALHLLQPPFNVLQQKMSTFM